MSSSEVQLRIDEIANEFLRQRRQGNEPKIQDFVAANADIANPLNDCLKLIVMFDDAASQADESMGTPRPVETESFPEIPDYQVVREIGRGGMGVVYEARQVSLDRTVALKILPASSFNHPTASERFELEAKSAARLHHSNIVPVYDIGRQGNNRYYSMQFIEGQSLDSVIETMRTMKGKSSSDSIPEPPGNVASDTIKFGLSETSPGRKPYYQNIAKLGVKVAEALDYAHENGVVHRDIKPSNLMLDETGSIWIMDFGLAKTDESDLTQTGDVVGTLRYMSPERFSGQCDGRSDTYSLGLTLYELLSRKPVFGADNRLSLIEFIKNREPEPLRNRDKQIPHDLETIVHKSISKDPRRRYATAGEMSADLQRFVNGQPILARRVGPVERGWLWAEKHRGLAATLAVLAAVLVATTVGSTIAAFYFRDLSDRNLNLAKTNSAKTLEADEARKDAVKETEMATEMLSIIQLSFEEMDTNVGVSKIRNARDVLLEVRRRLDESSLNDGARANMLSSLSRALLANDEFEEATAATEESRKLFEKVYGPKHEETLSSLTNLARCYHKEGRLSEAIAIAESAFDLKRETLSPEHVVTQRATLNLSKYYMASGQLDESISLCKELLETHRKLNVEDALTVEAMNKLVECYGRSGRLKEAIAMSKQAVSLSRKVLPAGHRDRHNAIRNLGIGYRQSGQYDKAIQVEEELVESQRLHFGPEDEETLGAMSNLANSYWRNEQLEEALKLREKTLALKLKALGEEHAYTLNAMANLALSYKDFGRLDEALQLELRALELNKQIYGLESTETIPFLNELGRTYKKMGLLVDALELAEQHLRLSRKVFGENHRQTWIAKGNYGSYLSNNRLQMVNALSLLHDDLPNWRESVGEDHPSTKLTLRNLRSTIIRSQSEAKVMMALRRYADAERLLQATLKYQGPFLADVNEVPLLLTQCSMAQENWKDALSLIDSSLAELDSAEHSSDKPAYDLAIELQIARSVCLAGQLDFDQALSAAEAVLQIEEASEISRSRARSVLALCLSSDKANDKASKQQLDKAAEQAVQAVAQLEGQWKELPNHQLVYLTNAIERAIAIHELNDATDKAASWQNKLGETQTRIRKRVTEISLEAAEEFHDKIRPRVIRTPASETVLPLFEHEIKFLRTLCEQYPNGKNFSVLGIAEYRMKNFEQAIAAANRCSELLGGKEDNTLRSFALAVLAMSHWQLGDEPAASNFRGQLDELMNQIGIDVDKDCREFASEVEALLDNINVSVK